MSQSTRLVSSLALLVAILILPSTASAYQAKGNRIISALDSVEPPSPAAPGPSLRVLFIGDGTHTGNGARLSHNLAYELFPIIASSGLQRRVVVGQLTAAGGDLQGLAERAHRVIQGLPWDYVVLVEHVSVAFQDRRRASDAIKLYEQVAKAAGARLVYNVFGPDSVRTGLTKAARSVGAIPALTWAAWTAAHAADSSIKLDDGFSGSSTFGAGHVTPWGHYLQALVYYQAITGRSPIGLKAQIPPLGVRPPLAGRSPVGGSGSPNVVTLSVKDMELLQRAATAALPLPGTLNRDQP